MKIKTVNASISKILFQTSDFYLCGYLLAKGMRFVKTIKISEKKVIFCLEDNPDRPQHISDYFSHKGLVDALEYKNKIGDLKTMLYNS